MTAASDALATPAGLTDDWQDWLAGNIVRGCTDADMLAVMTGNGFDAAYARVAIAVVRSMTERVQRTQPHFIDPYMADAPRWQSACTLPDEPVPRLVTSVVDPNIAVIENLLTAGECERLIALSAGKLERSRVVDMDGRLAVSGVRTSDGTHFARGENELVSNLEARIEAWTGIPVEQGEPLQILHYGIGGEYLPHHDWFDPARPENGDVLAQGGQRIATMVIYLNAVTAGGETVFPNLGLSVHPRPGAAVYFEYRNATGRLDERLLHAGRPVSDGEKWIATKWLRQSRYG